MGTTTDRGFPCFRNVKVGGTRLIYEFPEIYNRFSLPVATSRFH